MADETLGGELDPGAFRDLMSTFPSGVTVVTAADVHGVPFGMTCTSLCSVALDPPLLLVCLRTGSTTLSAIRRSGVFGVNFLHTGGQEAAELFSSGIPDRFERIQWRRTAHRALPCLPAHAHTVAECRAAGYTLGGDHTVVMGEVAGIARLAAGPPLLHGLRRYARWTDLQLAGPVELHPAGGRRADALGGG